MKPTRVLYLVFIASVAGILSSIYISSIYDDSGTFSEADYSINYFPFVDSIKDFSTSPTSVEAYLPPGFGGYYYKSDGTPVYFYTILRDVMYSSQKYTLDLYLSHGTRFNMKVDSVVHEGWGEQGRQLFSTIADYDTFMVTATHIAPTTYVLYTYLLSENVEGFGNQYDPVVSFVRFIYDPTSTGVNSNYHDLNLATVLAEKGYSLTYDNYNDIVLRPILAPYTYAPSFGAFYNDPDAVFAVFNIRDKSTTYSILTAKNQTLQWSNNPRVYVTSFVIPIGYIYTFDRSKVYLIFLAINSNQPSHLLLDYVVFSVPDYSYLEQGNIGYVDLGTDLYDPESYVIFMQPKMILSQGDSHDLEVNPPFKVAIYSPNKHRLVILHVAFYADAPTVDSYSFSIKDFDIDYNLDMSTVSENSISKAKLTWLDLVSPKSQVYGFIAFRNAILDEDMNYDPYSVEVYRYSDGQWIRSYLIGAIPKIEYMKPKTYNYPQKPSVAINGYYIPYLIDLQFKTNDGASFEGFRAFRLQVTPYKKYNITPTKFKVTLSYTYYITPISITYIKSDPDAPDTLNNVLVPVKITDQTVLNTIATVDGRDVRFFQSNSYGGDYWKYDGMTYAIKTISPSEAEFYILIPSISANSTITIYMYSGFQYAKAVAEDYYTLISTYPVLLPTS